MCQVISFRSRNAMAPPVFPFASQTNQHRWLIPTDQEVPILMLSAIYARLTPSIFGKSELHRLILQRSFLKSSLLTFEFQMDDNMHYESMNISWPLLICFWISLWFCVCVSMWFVGQGQRRPKFRRKLGVPWLEFIGVFKMFHWNRGAMDLRESWAWPFEKKDSLKIVA